MLPVVTRSAEVVLNLVPNSLRESALALGAPRWKVIFRIVLPTALPGLVTGSLLAVARAAGETAPLLFTSLPLLGTSFDLGNQMNSLPIQIFNDVQAPNDAIVARAWALSPYARRRRPPPHDLSPASPSGGAGSHDPRQSPTAAARSTRTRTGRLEPAQHGRRRRGARCRDDAERAAAARARAARSTSTSLQAFYGDNHAVRDVTLNYAANRVTAMIGPSGCGKSTVLRCLNRMHEEIPGARAEGNVTMDDIDIYDPKVDVVAVRRAIGMVFQKPNPFPTMSIFDNVAAGLRLAGIKGVDTKQRVERVAARRRAVGRGQGPARRARARPLRRPAAAAVHRPHDRGRSPRSS